MYTMATEQPQEDQFQKALQFVNDQALEYSEENAKFGEAETQCVNSLIKVVAKLKRLLRDNDVSLPTDVLAECDEAEDLQITYAVQQRITLAKLEGLRLNQVAFLNGVIARQREQTSPPDNVA
jgi:hypothetical protein